MLVAPAAEFPNDNPALHRGAIWVNQAPCGPLEAEVPAIEDVVVAALTETVAPPEVVEHTIAENAPVMAIEPEPIVRDVVVADVLADAVAHDVVVAVADDVVVADPEPAPERPAPLESLIVLSAAPRDQIEPELVDEIVVEELDFDLSNVPLETGAPPPPPAPAVPPPAEDDAYAGLVKTLGDVVVAEGGTVDALLALLGGDEQTTALAWRAVLRGEVDDISTCGSAMLDEWAAAVVAAAIGAPARAPALRRELRNRGVCAFGLIEAA